VINIVDNTKLTGGLLVAVLLLAAYGGTQYLEPEQFANSYVCTSNEKVYVCTGNSEKTNDLSSTSKTCYYTKIKDGLEVDTYSPCRNGIFQDIISYCESTGCDVNQLLSQNLNEVPAETVVNAGGIIVYDCNYESCIKR